MMRRLLTIALLLAASSAWAQNDFIRFQKPSVAGAGSGGATFTAQVLLPDGTVGAPSIAFTTDPDTGLYKLSGNRWALSGAGGNTAFAGPNNELYAAVSLAIGDSNTVFLDNDAANTLALRNGGTAGTPVPQTFNIYNFCDGAACATGYERAEVKWSANAFWVTTTSAGTGTARNVIVGPTGNGNLYLYNNGALRWTVAATTFQLAPGVADSYDLGTNAETVKSFFVARSIQGSKSKTLTDNTATAFVRLTVADDDYEGCAFGWTAYAEDADTDARQVTKGRNNVAILNNGGTETCAFSASADDVATNVTAGTLACTFDCAAGTNTVDLRATCDTSLDAAAETLTFEYRLDCESTITTVTPQ